MELDDDSAASSDYSLLGRMYKSKSLPGPGMQIIFTPSERETYFYNFLKSLEGEEDD